MLGKGSLVSEHGRRQTDEANVARKVSFVIPCYNGRQYLTECLQSIARVAGPSDEVLVVDDGSTEDIRGVVEAFTPLARYIWQPNQGPGAARNNGVRLATGEYVRFVDSDDCLLPSRGLDDQIALLDANPDVGLVYAQAVKVTKQGQAVGIKKPPFTAVSYVRTGDAEMLDLLFYNYITTSSVIVRRSVLSQVGPSPFRPHLFTAQDWDCWLRIAQISSVGYVAKPVVSYRVHEQSVTARKTLSQFLDAHTDILDHLFDDPKFAQRYASLREAAYSSIYARAAELAYDSGQSKLVWDYAWKALSSAVANRQLQQVAGCLALIVKSQIPTGVRQSLRRVSMRWRSARTAALLATRRL